jgi:uncharacterized cupin superfamily protein
MNGLAWRRISPARYTTDAGWEVRRIAPGAWSVLKWHEERGEWLVVIDHIPTKTQAMAKADGLRR